MPYPALLALGLLAAGVVKDPPKVEFVEVEGHSCLQLRVLRPGAQRADVRAAEMRWLEQKHPGAEVRGWEVILSLFPGVYEGSYADSTAHRETAHLALPDASVRTVCFDLEAGTP